MKKDFDTAGAGSDLATSRRTSEEVTRRATAARKVIARLVPSAQERAEICQILGLEEG